MKYPCITRNDNEIEMILFNEDTAIILNGIHKGELHDVYPRFRSRYTNITHEYLSNTWGVVESKEHAEFIIELAELHGFEVDGYSERADTYFYFGDDYLGFVYSAELASSRNEKQITIPLPPKADINEAGHNLVFAAGECKEWPCVGDEVVTPTGKGKLVTPKPDEQGVVIVMVDDEDYGKIYKRVSLKALQKPKTPEEALRDDLINRISSYLAVIPGLLDNPDEAMYASHQAACELLTKYNITPKEV